LANCGGGDVTNQINELFAKALGITEPWFVKEVDFDSEQQEMTIRVDFVRGARFRHPRAPGNTRFTIPRSSGCGTSTSFNIDA